MQKHAILDPPPSPIADVICVWLHSPSPSSHVDGIDAAGRRAGGGEHVVAGCKLEVGKSGGRKWRGREN